MIVLSNAHHRLYRGASNQTAGISEWEYSCEINRRLANLFLEKEEEIYLLDTSWKSGSYKETLREKVRIINSIRPDLAIENHLNACEDKEVFGCETLYFQDSIRGQRLADMIQTQLLTIREIKKDRGIKERNDLILLSGTTCPAIITEPLFLSHDNSARLLLDDKWLSKLTRAIFSGLEEYLDGER